MDFCSGATVLRNRAGLFPAVSNVAFPPSLVSADEGMLLKLDFRDEFKLEESPECRYDFLEVRDGQHGYSNLLGNFCGTNFPPEITSKTRYLWLRFRSDDSIEGKGFKAVWSMIPRPTSRKSAELRSFLLPVTPHAL